MRERNERIHIRARKATKLHWAMICKAMGYKNQADAFASLMVDLLNREMDGNGILKDINTKRISTENYDWGVIYDSNGEYRNEGDE